VTVLGGEWERVGGCAWGQRLCHPR